MCNIALNICNLCRIGFSSVLRRPVVLLTQIYIDPILVISNIFEDHLKTLNPLR
jgi:hypothetical protein